MTLEITLHCNGCDGVIDRPETFKGNREERAAAMKESGWTKTEDEQHVGPICGKIYERVDKIKVGLNTGIIKMPVDQPMTKPSMEFVDDNSMVWAYPSRYCELGFESKSGVNSHEHKFHQDQYRKGKRGHRKKVQIHQSNMSVKGGRGLPKCQQPEEAT